MEKSGGYSQRGFTIVEVALVLAIAGLIFLMVFLALPALQRSERDTERRDDITTLLRKVKDYQTANRGALPTNWTDFKDDYLGGDKFEDPNGSTYDLRVVDCGTNNPDAKCSNTTISTIEKDATTFEKNNNKLVVVTKATCKYIDAKGFTSAVRSSNSRKIAVLYKMETGQLYCQNS